MAGKSDRGDDSKSENPKRERARKEELQIFL
jgi:hypothetical protein